MDINTNILLLATIAFGLGGVIGYNYAFREFMNWMDNDKPKEDQ